MTAVTVSTDLADVVEQHLGDPYDTANPRGFAAVLAAHETGRPRTGDLLPDALTASAHPTPEAWLHALRALYRRSPGLGSTVRTGLHENGPRAAALAVGACVGALDSALRVTVRHLRGRLLYGAPAIDIPQLREVLAGVHADLLLCDVLTTLAVRGEDALPAREGAHELAVLGLVPRVLQGALDRLSVLMGSRFYVREGETGIFQLLLNGAQRELFAPAHGPRPAPRSPCR
ncbi:hypothetical protein OJ963_24430 [Streptomyces sp. RS2]|uniref:hypothetical protein n=1 Tax=Streptomyces sp. RS2 TaxID=1451205 RepID=UPI0021F90F5A|nr:hypothetical protein [Streptomyces sp. RS2]MCW1097019.1 hypothetical protein [Streptomyces sp. RS2]